MVSHTLHMKGCTQRLRNLHKVTQPNKSVIQNPAQVCQTPRSMHSFNHYAVLSSSTCVRISHLNNPPLIHSV